MTRVLTGKNVTSHEMPYTPPPIYVGDAVIYKETPNSQVPILGFVTAVNERSVDMIIFPPNSFGLIKFNARHIDDPTWNEFQDFGVWDFQNRVKDVEKRLSAIEHRAK